MSFLHHSAAVHIPLALAVLFPFAYMTIVWSIHWQWLPKRVWWLLMGFVPAQLACLALSYRTGLRDSMSSEAATEIIQHHRQLAWNFSWIWLLILAGTAVVFLAPPRLSRIAHWAALVLMVTQFLWAIELGELGGKMIFH